MNAEPASTAATLAPSAPESAPHRPTEPAPPRRRTLPRVWPFLLWLLVFYGSWLTLVISRDLWASLNEHRPIAAAMLFGSYIAGSTPAGGGSVGFPVLVLFFDQPASLGRDFSFAIQSIGMTSASIFIFSRRLLIAPRILFAAMLGSVVATPLGVAFLTPHVPDLFVKLLFAVVWCSFGVMHLIKGREIIAAHGRTHASPRLEFALGLFIGVIGGALIASFTGVGIDMLLYTLMILLLRSDVRIAIPTSVIIMAFTSLVGIATRAILAQAQPDVWAFSPELFLNWLAAAPVVALGAPLGVLVVALIPRGPTLVIVSLICVGQYVWTIVDERISGGPLLASLAGLAAAQAVFHVLYRLGDRLRAGRHPTTTIPADGR